MKNRRQAVVSSRPPVHNDDATRNLHGVTLMRSTLPARAGLSAAFLALAFLVTPSTPAADTAPAPRAASAATEFDQALIDQIKTKNELMKNLAYLSDIIGGR